MTYCKTRRRPRLLTLAALLTACVAGPARADDLGGLLIVRDWLAACDNVRTCRALSLPREDGEDQWYLRIDRDGEADAPVRLMILTTGESARRDGRLTLRADGQPVAVLTPGKGLSLQDDALIVEDRQAIAALIAAARRAAALTLTFETAAGRQAEPSISLDGASAALLWIDERQQRLDTVTALVRRGQKPTSAVPAPPPLPAPPSGVTGNAAPPAAISAEIRQEMARQSKDDCEPSDTPVDTDAAKLFRLGPSLLLASAPCFSGAYNFSRAYFLVDEGPQPNVRPALFPRPYRGEDAGGPDNVLTNGDPDEREGQVSHFARGRGIGDCGDFGSWQWDGQAFRPIAFSRMPTCRRIGIDHWPALYRTR
jgi:hypothetical protein